MKYRQNIIPLVILILTLFVACRNDGEYHPTEEDTINLLNTVLKSPILDSILIQYRDSTMKIVKDKYYMRKEYPVLWHDKKVLYVEKTKDVLEYDTTGALQKFYVTFGIPKVKKDSAEVAFGFRYLGSSVLWVLTKKEGKWVINDTEAALQ